MNLGSVCCAAMLFVAPTTTMAVEPISKVIYLIRTHDVDSEVAKATFEFVRMNVQGTTRPDLGSVNIDPCCTRGMLRELSELRTKDDALVIALVGTSAPSGSPAVAYSEKLGSAAVMVEHLPSAESGMSEHRLAHIERAVIYAIGKLVGMPICQNPYCVLSTHHARKDQLPSRGFCPVCADSARRRLMKFGVNEGTGTRRVSAPAS